MLVIFCWLASILLTNKIKFQNQQPSDKNYKTAILFTTKDCTLKLFFIIYGNSN